MTIQTSRTDELRESRRVGARYISADTRRGEPPLYLLARAEGADKQSFEFGYIPHSEIVSVKPYPRDASIPDIKSETDTAEIKAFFSRESKIRHPADIPLIGRVFRIGERLYTGRRDRVKPFRRRSEALRREIREVIHESDDIRTSAGRYKI